MSPPHLTKDQNCILDGTKDLLPIRIYEENNQKFITIQHAALQFVPFARSLKDLAEAIGLQEQNIHTDYPTL